MLKPVRMPKSANVDHVYQHPWSEISYAVFRKYPNPSRPDVLAVDLLSRSIDPETGVLQTRRMVTVKGPLPTWMEKVIGRQPACYFIEDASIDPRTQTMTLKSRNVTLDKVMLMEECCVYKKHENENWTEMQLEGTVTSFTRGFASRIEDFMSKTYKANAAKGREITEHVCNMIKQEAAALKQEAADTFAKAESLGTRLKHEAEGFAAVAPRPQRMPALD